MTSRKASQVFVACAFIATLFISAQSAARGSKFGVVIALLASVAIPLLAFAARRPLIIPFSIYAASIPFNDLGNLGGIGTLSKFLGFASVAAISIWLVVNRKADPPPSASFFWIAVLLYSSLSPAWAADPSLPWPHVITLAQLMAVYVLVSIAPASDGDLRSFSALTVAGGVLAAIYAFHSLATGAQVDVDGRLFLHDASSAEIDPDQLAATLILPISFALVASVACSQYWLRLTGLIAACLQFVAILLTGSRGALLAIIVVSVYILCRTNRRLRLLVPIGIATLTAVPFWNTLAARLTTALASGGSGRTDIWEVGLRAFRHVWLLGAGVGNFAIAYDREYLSVFQTNDQGWSRASHSLIVGSLVEGGIIGTALTLAAFIAQFLMLRGIKKSNSLYYPRIAVEASLLGMLVAALFLDVLYEKHLWLILTAATLIRSVQHSRGAHALGRYATRAGLPSYKRLENVMPPVKTGQAHFG